MKKFVRIVFLCCCLGLTVHYQEDIVRYFMQNFIYHDSNLMEANQYYQASNFAYVQVTEEAPKNKQDLLNLIYTSLDKGLSNISFYCPKSYKQCREDMQALIQSNIEIGNINNLVHPLNSYQRLNFNLDHYGHVEIEVEHLYSDEEISLIQQKTDQLYEELYDRTKTIPENIQIFHDYIINHTIYDVNAETWDYSGRQVYPQKSNTAYGLLFHGVSICGGYADTMAIFLSKMGLKNYRIASQTHIWNLVLIDGQWKHLDLTWDDPVTSDRQNLLLHTYFLLSTKELKALGDHEHDYVTTVYLEANESE